MATSLGCPVQSVVRPTWDSVSAGGPLKLKFWWEHVARLGP
jgi:hypothetical protein